MKHALLPGHVDPTFDDSLIAACDGPARLARSLSIRANQSDDRDRPGQRAPAAHGEQRREPSSPEPTIVGLTVASEGDPSIAANSKTGTVQITAFRRVSTHCPSGRERKTDKPRGIGTTAIFPKARTFRRIRDRREIYRTLRQGTSYTPCLLYVRAALDSWAPGHVGSTRGRDIGLNLIMGREPT